MSFTVTISDDSAIRAMAALLGQMPELRRAIVLRTAFDVVSRMAETVPVDTGRLRASYRVLEQALEMDAEGQQGEGSIFTEETADTMRVVVSTAVEYAAVIEYGTAGRPPGNHLAVALEEARRALEGEVRDLFGERLAEAWGAAA